MLSIWIDDIETAIFNLELNFIFSFEKILFCASGQTNKIVITTAANLLSDLHQLRIRQVEALSDGGQIGELVFMIDEAKLLAHLVLFCQIN